MKRTRLMIAILICVTIIIGYNFANPSTNQNNLPEGAIAIDLSDNIIKVDGKIVKNDSSQGVYVSNDIVYYEDGKDFTYGEGAETEAYGTEEAIAHTVVNITKPGTYGISGKLSKGQIAVDMDEDAKDDENAVVTLIMNGTDINCDIAPAVIFYNVHEHRWRG